MWFKTYNFKENPFKITPKPKTLVGYESQVVRAQESITSGDLLTITGPTGYGKTTLLRRLKDWAHKNRYNPVYFDCTYSSSENVNFKKILSVKDWFGLRTRAPRKKDRIVLFMDEVQRLDKNKMEELKYFYDSERIHAIAMSTINFVNVHESMRTRIAENVELCNLSAQDLQEMLKRRLKEGTNPFNPEGLDELVLLSGMNPRAVLINAEKVCKRLHRSFPQGNIGKNDIEEVLTDDRNRTYRPVNVQNVSEVVSEKPKKEGYVQRIARITVEESKNKAPEPTSGKDVSWAWDLRVLSPLQKQIVRALSDAARPLNYDEICAMVGKKKGSVSKQLSRLALISDTDLMEKKGITEPVVTKIIADGHPVFMLTERYKKLAAKE